MTFEIRSLKSSDRDQWDILWQGYLSYYETNIADDVTQSTWARLMDDDVDIHGYCAVSGEGKLAGIVHFLYHPVTWSKAPRCYLEDLFTSQDFRGKGVGRALIEAVYRAADERGADQVYWLTQDFNHTAQRLYDKIATKTPFIKYAR